MPRTLITAPAAEPVTTAAVKAHLKITDSDSDTQIAGFIKSARRMVENSINRALITQTWDLQYDRFPNTFHVSLPPLQSVTSITYTDTAGDSQVLASSQYKVDAVSIPGRIVPAYGVTWPATRCEIAAVTVRIVCGYAGDGGSPEDLAANVPQDLKDCICMLAGDLFENREARLMLRIEDNPTVDRILSQYRVRFPVS